MTTGRALALCLEDVCNRVWRRADSATSVSCAEEVLLMGPSFRFWVALRETGLQSLSIAAKRATGCTALLMPR